VVSLTSSESSARTALLNRACHGRAGSCGSFLGLCRCRQSLACHRWIIGFATGWDHSTFLSCFLACHFLFHGRLWIHRQPKVAPIVLPRTNATRMDCCDSTGMRGTGIDQGSCSSCTHSNNDHDCHLDHVGSHAKCPSLCDCRKGASRLEDFRTWCPCKQQNTSFGALTTVGKKSDHSTLSTVWVDPTVLAACFWKATAVRQTAALVCADFCSAARCMCSLQRCSLNNRCVGESAT
jgi:hypothetical protein